MKTNKRLISLILAICLLISLNIPASAAETQDSITEVDIPIIQIDSQQEYEDFLAQQEENQPTPQSGYSEIKLLVIRNGIQDTCEVILHWSGPDLYDAWRFKSLTISNKSSLDPTTYLSYGNGITYTTKYTSMAAIGSVTLTYCSIPSNITGVKATFSDLQGRRVSDGWLSALLYNSSVPIN